MTYYSSGLAGIYCGDCIEVMYSSDLAEIYCGDCIEVMAQMPENSVDAIVTDPPYGLEFMGKEWDRFGGKDVRELWRAKGYQWKGKQGLDNLPAYMTNSLHLLAYQEWTTQWATQALRVLKPGGFLLSFGGTKTYHRLVCGLEDAGFEIRDTICWLYGSGFPKSLDISKQMDKMAGHYPDKDKVGYCACGECHEFPYTLEAKEWLGGGTALKPAFEPICVARKPLSEKTVASNVLKWGTGGLDIDGARISYQGEVPNMGGRKNAKMGGEGYGFKVEGRPDEPNYQGRWPANVILDEEAARMLDEQSGELTSGKMSPAKHKRHSEKGYSGGWLTASLQDTIGDSGGASRFFYCAKSSSKERGKGNTHPTAKPIRLMEYLIKLVSREGAVILDPFAGSGSTVLAAVALGRKCIGIEQSQEYCEILKNRCRQMELGI